MDDGDLVYMDDSVIHRRQIIRLDPRQDRPSVVVMMETWQVCSCRLESYFAQYHSRCGDALVVRPLTPWLISKLAGRPQILN